MRLSRFAGFKLVSTLLAAFAAGSLLCRAGEDSDGSTPSEAPPFRMPIAANRTLARIGMVNPDAAPGELAAAQLRALRLQNVDALRRAIANRDGRTLELYLAANASPNVRGDHGETPLLAALRSRNWEWVKRFLQAGANPAIADNAGITPLMAAVEIGHVPTVRNLLAAGAPVELVDKDGQSALARALARRQRETIQTLLDRSGMLPAGPAGNALCAAAMEFGDRTITEEVLRRLPPGLSWTPVARAQFLKALETRDTILGPLLLEKFAGPPAGDEHSQPLLAYAVAKHDFNQIRTLIFLGADPNTVLDQPGDPAFRQLVGSNFMRYYLENTAGLNVLMLAAGMKQTETVKLLLECGANRNASTRKTGLIALYFAAWADSPETIQVLLGSAPSKEDVRIEVSLDEQRARYYRDGQLILTSEVSTGRDGFATRPGEYVITDKHLEHHSTLYHNASMPYFMRLSCQAFGLHEGYVTGRPASHGCIRLPGDVARRLFKEAPVGTWVSITP